MTQISDALRYAGIPRPSGTDRAAMEKRWETLQTLCPPRYLFRVFLLEEAAEGPGLTGAGLTLPGSLARRMLDGCKWAAVGVCTLGAGFDARLRSLEQRDMAEAVLWDGCGSAAVEAGCDEMEKEIAARFPGRFLTDRFSPGYGDLPLSLQPDILRLTDAGKRLGVYAGTSYLLLPVKTTTCFIGVADTPRPARIRGCDSCARKEQCALRKGGAACGLETE